MDAEHSIADLLEAVARGDRQALRSIYQREATRLFGVANAILRDREAAADALQDAFVKVWTRAGQYDPTRGEAGAWLAGIVRHRALDAARARGRELPSDDPNLGDEATEPDVIGALAHRADCIRLRACLAQLDEKNRKSIVLAFVHGLSHTEIAERLGTPLGTVKAWVRRGLLALKACLS